MPKIDAVAGPTNESHKLGSQNILIKISVFILDDEYSPDDEETLLTGLDIVQQSRRQNKYIDKAIKEFFKIQLDLLLQWCQRGRSYLEIYIANLCLIQLACI